MNSLINNVVQVVDFTTSKIYVYIISIFFTFFHHKTKREKKKSKEMMIQNSWLILICNFTFSFVYYLGLLKVNGTMQGYTSVILWCGMGGVGCLGSRQLRLVIHHLGYLCTIYDCCSKESLLMFCLHKCHILFVCQTFLQSYKVYFVRLDLIL